MKKQTKSFVAILTGSLLAMNTGAVTAISCVAEEILPEEPNADVAWDAEELEEDVFIEEPTTTAPVMGTEIAWETTTISTTGTVGPDVIPGTDFQPQEFTGEGYFYKFDAGNDDFYLDEELDMSNWKFHWLIVNVDGEERDIYLGSDGISVTDEEYAHCFIVDTSQVDIHQQGYYNVYCSTKPGEVVTVTDEFGNTYTVTMTDSTEDWRVNVIPRPDPYLFITAPRQQLYTGEEVRFSVGGNKTADLTGLTVTAEPEGIVELGELEKPLYGDYSWYNFSVTALSEGTVTLKATTDNGLEIENELVVYDTNMQLPFISSDYVGNNTTIYFYCPNFEDVTLSVKDENIAKINEIRPSAEDDWYELDVEMVSEGTTSLVATTTDGKVRVCELVANTWETTEVWTGTTTETVTTTFTTTTDPNDPTLRPGKLLTLADVVALSQSKGADLTWADFAEYACKDIGSGICLERYLMEDGYMLQISGLPEQKPDNMILYYHEDNGIDIRTDDVEAFINANASTVVTGTTVPQEEFNVTGTTTAWTTSTFHTSTTPAFIATTTMANDPTIREGKPLLLEDVIRLSKSKGADLTWADFAEYACTDIGSGLYVERYDLDCGYTLLIGGVPEREPDYMALYLYEGIEIDIRTEDVEAFIGDDGNELPAGTTVPEGGGEEATTTTATGTTTTTSVAEDGNTGDAELPQTGYSRFYKVLAGIAAGMTVTGVAMVTKGRKKETL